MKNLIRKFAQDESGATAIEYSLLASLVAVAIIPALTSLEGGITGALGDAAAAL